MHQAVQQQRSMLPNDGGNKLCTAVTTGLRKAVSGFGNKSSTTVSPPLVVYSVPPGRARSIQPVPVHHHTTPHNAHAPTLALTNQEQAAHHSCNPPPLLLSSLLSFLSLLFSWVLSTVPCVYTVVYAYGVCDISYRGFSERGSADGRGRGQRLPGHTDGGDAF